MKLRWQHVLCLVRDPSAMPPCPAATWSVDTLVACRTPAWHGTAQGFSWRHTTGPRCTQGSKISLEGTVTLCATGLWHSMHGPDISIYLSPAAVASPDWNRAEKSPEVLLRRLPRLIQMPNAGCKDAWILQCLWEKLVALGTKPLERC